MKKQLWIGMMVIIFIIFFITGVMPLDNLLVNIVFTTIVGLIVLLIVVVISLIKNHK